MYTPPPVTTTTIASSICPKCGIIKRSGKSSCCGHGGSWFKLCGGTGNTNVHYTWHEGIQACKARSQTKKAIAQQVNAAQQKGNHPSNDADIVNSKSVSTAATTFALTSVNTLTPTLVTTVVIESANASAITSTFGERHSERQTERRG